MIHPCQGTSSTVKGLAAGNRLQPITFERLPVTVSPDKQTLWLNGTFICLEEAPPVPAVSDTLNQSASNESDEASSAEGEPESQSVPVAAVIGASVAVVAVLVLAVGAIAMRSYRRRHHSHSQQSQLQMGEATGKVLTAHPSATRSCEAAAQPTHKPVKTGESVGPRSPGLPSSGARSSGRLGSTLHMETYSPKGVATSAHSKRRHQFSEASALSHASIQDLEVFDLIGAGGYGNVYRGYWKGHEVAVKTILFQDTGASDRGKLDRACREAAIATELSHPNVVCTLSHQLQQMQSSLKGELVDYKLYLIQEFCFGGPLSNLIQEGCLSTPAGGVQMKRVLTILRQVALGAEYMHRNGLMHADLNPRNILLQLDESICPQGRNGFDRSVAWKPLIRVAAAALDDERPRAIAKLADFGLSVQPDKEATHVSNFRLGTPFYLAPEVRKDKQLRFASDVYSFGVVMWEIFTGMPPFVKKNGRLTKHPRMGRLPTVAPLNYASLMQACLSHEPDRRPTFTQALDVLNDLVGEIAVGHYISAGDGILPVERMESRKQWPDDEKSVLS